MHLPKTSFCDSQREIFSTKSTGNNALILVEIFMKSLEKITGCSTYFIIGSWETEGIHAFVVLSTDLGMWQIQTKWSSKKLNIDNCHRHTLNKLLIKWGEARFLRKFGDIYLLHKAMEGSLIIIVLGYKSQICKDLTRTKSVLGYQGCRV